MLLAIGMQCFHVAEFDPYNAIWFAVSMAPLEAFAAAVPV